MSPQPKSVPKDVIHKKHDELKTFEEKRIWWESRSTPQLELLARTLNDDLMEAYARIEKFKQAWAEFGDGEL